MLSVANALRKGRIYLTFTERLLSSLPTCLYQHVDRSTQTTLQSNTTSQLLTFYYRPHFSFSTNTKEHEGYNNLQLTITSLLRGNHGKSWLPASCGMVCTLQDRPFEYAAVNSIDWKSVKSLNELLAILDTAGCKPLASPDAAAAVAFELATQGDLDDIVKRIKIPSTSDFMDSSRHLVSEKYSISHTSPQQEIDSSARQQLAQALDQLILVQKGGTILPNQLDGLLTLFVVLGHTPDPHVQQTIARCLKDTQNFRYIEEGSLKLYGNCKVGRTMTAVHRTDDYQPHRTDDYQPQQRQQDLVYTPPSDRQGTPPTDRQGTQSTDHSQASGYAQLPFSFSVVLIMRLCAAASVKDSEVWHTLGKLLTDQLELIPADNIAPSLLASATSGFHDTCLIDGISKYLTPRHGRRSIRSRTGHRGSSVLQCMGTTALTGMLHALVLMRHADSHLLEALADEVLLRLDSVAPHPHPNHPTGTSLFGSKVSRTNIQTTPVHKPGGSSGGIGRGFSLRELSQVAYACVTLGHQSTALLLALAREAFSKMLLMIDFQEQQLQQSLPYEASSLSSLWSEVKPYDLPLLVWSLHQGGHCQASMMDATALLLEPHLGDLLPHEVLLLLETCQDLLQETFSSSNVPHQRAPVGGNDVSSSGAAQLMASLATVISNSVRSYSPRQVAQVASHYAAVHYFDGELMSSLCSQVTPGVGKVSCRPLMWGPISEVIDAAAQMSYMPSSLLDAVDASTSSSLNSVTCLPKKTGEMQVDNIITTRRDEESASLLWELNQEYPQFDSQPRNLLPLPPVSLMMRLAWSSAWLGRKDHAVQEAAALGAWAVISATEAPRPSDGDSLGIMQVCELVWALAVSGHQCLQQRQQQGTPGSASTQPHRKSMDKDMESSLGGGGVTGSKVQEFLQSQRRLSLDPDPEASEALVSKLYWSAASVVVDVLSPHVLLLCQAHIMLLLTLTGKQLQTQRNLPRDWQNTMHYAWEQHLRKQQHALKQTRRQTWYTGAPAWHQKPHGQGTHRHPWWPLELPELHIQEQHELLCKTLSHMGIKGAQSGRFVKVHGFMVPIDVTVTLPEGQAVTFMLDGPSSYTRSQQPQSCQETALPPLPSLMGSALWRQQAMQAMGWIVARVHWHDWEVAVNQGEEARTHLLKGTLANCGL